jgi:hypothetical protein
MKMKDKILCGIVASLALGCSKPYKPAIVASNNNYLVVEGNINTGTDSTTIQLSRTTNIASGITSKPELNATVIIQDNQNGSYSLTSKGNGAYTSALLTLDPTRMYRLNITTSDKNIYVSDYVPAKTSPSIDSVGYKIESNGVQIYVSTHDPNNATHYYHWNYNETWEFHVKYPSSYISNGTSVVPRQADQNVYQCWGNDIASDIELGSSAKLSQDVIYQNPLIFIPSTSEKIEIRYSVLVKQYAMTTDGYNYYNLLKQNTEELGSIFDAQPSTLTGNIHCTTNVALPVIGYVTAGTYAQRRIYINYTQLPGWITQYPYDCETPDTVKYVDINKLLPLPNPNVILYEVDNKQGINVGYLVSDPECADCTIRGTTVQPGFWVAGPNGL